MATRPRLTEKQRARLSNKFFGRLIAEYSCEHGRTYFVEDGPAEAPWWPYRVVEQGPGFVVLEFAAGEETTRQRFEFEGDCYKVPVKWLGVSEYFCRTIGGEG